MLITTVVRPTSFVSQAELFYPYYGTHHCWEEQQPWDDDVDHRALQNALDADQQLAVALHVGGGEGFDFFRDG
jgi:hypothetical protein